MAAPARSELRADCQRCVGLCCVAPGFAASADFAIDKPAGQPCPHLEASFGCGIHDDLRPRGFAGCTVYDCFGAGQHVAQVTFRGRDWRREPDLAASMFATFAVVRQLHELLWYVDDALGRAPASSVHAELRATRAVVEATVSGSADELAARDVDDLRRPADELLLQASALIRNGSVGLRSEHRGADLIGRDLRTVDLRGANLRGAYLIGADLRAVDLRLADVIGADLRGADARGADLSDTLFLTQVQVNAVRGDAHTRLPAWADRPPSWDR